MQTLNIRLFRIVPTDNKANRLGISSMVSKEHESKEHWSDMPGISEFWVGFTLRNDPISIAVKVKYTEYYMQFEASLWLEISVNW